MDNDWTEADAVVSELLNRKQREAAKRRLGVIDSMRRAAHDVGYMEGVGFALDETKKLRAEVARLREALQALHSACDGLMGDSDLDEDDSPEFKAMFNAARLLWPEPQSEPR